MGFDLLDLASGSGPGMPIIMVEIGVSDAFAESRFYRQMEQPPRPLSLPALVDTGASLTVIDESVVEALNLIPRGYCDVRSIHLPPDGEGSDSQRHQNFDISIKVPQSTGSHLQIGNLQVISAPLPQKDFKVLLGRDLLTGCRIEIDFTTGKMKLEVTDSSKY